MTPEIEKRIKAVQAGRVPTGYCSVAGTTMPKEWNLIKLGSIFGNRIDINHSDYELLSITADKGVIPRSSIADKDNSSEDKSKYKHICVGDIGYNTMRMWQGVCALSAYDGIVSPAYTILAPSDGICASYFAYLFKMQFMINLFYRNSQGLVDDTRCLKYEWFKNIEIKIPPIGEQKKIAEILATQDKVIELKEKLIAEKQSQKKYLMSVLLGNDFKKPFKLNGVTIDKKKWDKKKFEDVLTFLRNNTFSRADMEDSQGQVKNIHYGDILVKYGTILDCDKDIIPFLKKEKQNYSNIVYLEDGDIIIADTAEDETCGKMVEIIHKKNDLIVAGLHTIACRPANKLFASKWLGYYMNSPAYHNQLIPLITGIKVSSISKSAISETTIAIPSLPEQKAIADVLSAADEEISLLQKDLEQEKLKKKSLMQLLLTGLVRVNE